MFDTKNIVCVFFYIYIIFIVKTKTKQKSNYNTTRIFKFKINYYKNKNKFLNPAHKKKQQNNLTLTSNKQTKHTSMIAFPFQKIQKSVLGKNMITTIRESILISNFLSPTLYTILPSLFHLNFLCGNKTKTHANPSN